MHVRVLAARQLHAGAARRELLEEAAVLRIGKPLLHELPGGVGKLDHGAVAGRAAIPGEREQHESVVVGVARVVERRTLDRDHAKPAAVRRARGAHQERKAVLCRLAENWIATQQIGVAEHVGETRLHQRGTPRRRNRCAQRIEIFEKPARRIVDTREPKAANMVDQPRPQRAQVVRIEDHDCVALPSSDSVS